MTKYFTQDGDKFVEVEDELLTTEQVNSVVKERGERIARQKFSDYDELKEKAGQVDKVTKDFEGKLKEKDTLVSDLNAKLGKAQLETSKVKLTHEFKLSDELAEFVTGDTEDEMRQRAEKLSKGIGTSGFKIDKDKKPDDTKTDSAKIAKSLLRPANSDD